MVLKLVHCPYPFRRHMPYTAAAQELVKDSLGFGVVRIHLKPRVGSRLRVSVKEIEDGGVALQVNVM